MCSGIGRGERGLCLTIVHHSLVTDGLVTDAGRADLGCWSHGATVPVGQLRRAHSAGAPHLSGLGIEHVLQFSESSVLCGPSLPSGLRLQFAPGLLNYAVCSECR